MGAISELYIQMQDEFINTCDNVENGNIELLEAVIEMRKQKAFHEQMIKDINEFEAQNYNDIENSAKDYQNEFRGVKFEFRGGRKTFDFKGIEEVQIAKDNAKEIEQKYKTAWEMKQKGFAPVDEETGEVLQIPIVKYGKSSMIVKLPK